MRQVPPSRRGRGASFQIEELEPRLLFSADAATLLGLPVSLAAPAEPAHAEAEATDASIPVVQAVLNAPAAAQVTVRHELVFVDAAVPDADKLIAGIKADARPDKVIEVVMIQTGEDGLAAITEALQQRQNLDAVHILSHGDASGLAIGTTRLNAAALTARLGEVSSWGAALSADADLLLYGCDLASTTQGQALADNLAMLTGADVAASSDLTGAAALGGDWVMEYQKGHVESDVVVGAGLASSWDHVLATSSFQDGSNGYTGTQDTYLELLGPGNNNSASTTLSAGRATTQNGFQTLIKFDDIIGAGAGQIPQGSVITNVTLTVYMTSSPTFTNPTFSLYRMLAAWSDTSTYSSMGSGVDGGEYRAIADQTITDSGVKSYTFASNAAMIATVQGWLNNPSTNQGWYLFCDDNSSQASFASSENATVANRPKLSVTYTLPTPQNIDLDGNNSSGATGNNYSGAFTEQTPVKIADTDATIAGGTATNLTGMTVTLANPLDGALESMTATTTGTNITASYNSGTGVLTLSGTDTVARYQTVLRSVTYNNTSDNPDTTSRTINVVATDSSGASTNTATTTLSVTRVNDAPVITSNGGGASGAVNVLEHQTAVTTVTATDPDSGSPTYSISGGADAAKFTIDAVTGVLTFITAPNFDSPGDVGGNNVYDVIVRAFDGSLADTQALAVTVVNVNEVPVGTSKTVTTNEDTAYTFTVADFGFTDPNDSPANTLLAVKITTLPVAGSLTLNGVAVTVGQFVSAANIASNLLKFTPAANANGTGYASFTFQVQDNGGTANGGADLDVTPRTMTVNVTAVNDAPVGASTTITTLEDTAYTFTAADFGFSDPNDSPANTLSGVKITTLPASGSLTLNGVAVTAGQVISAANIASNLLKFTPAANANGTGNASFTFQVQDNGGTANGGVDLDVTPRTMTVNVTAVNDAPAGTDKTVTTLEDTAYTFTAADFGFTDPNDSPANTLLGVKITTLPGSGSLTLNGVAVTAGQVVSAANIASNLLKFTPAANANGAGYATFTFQVQDNGGTANGGVDLDATPNTITVNVTAVNDAPLGTSKTVTTLEDTAYTFTAADFGFSDPNDSPANTLSGVRITTLPATGSLTLNGVAVTAGQVISAANIASNLLKFTPAANANGTGNASFTFQVQDNGGTANGGVNQDATPRTMTVNVTAVNDAPVGTSKTVTTLEDTVYTFTAADFGFTDPNDSPANTFSGVRITTLPATGSLTLNGVAVTAGQVISAANIASNLLKFTPAANANGAGNASFTFQVQDNGGTANGGVNQDTTPRTMTVNVTAVNDAPVGTSKTVTTLEDTAYTFTAADFGFTDPNDSPANTLSGVRITTLPATGSLRLNGVAVTAGQVISAANIASNLLRFTPAANANGAGNASFTFQVQDNGGTANGGVNQDATPRTMTVNVTTVNDAPSGANRTVTTTENTNYVFNVTDFGFTDASDSPANTLLAVRITTIPGTGTLSLNGVALNDGDVIQASDILAGLLVFTPVASGTGQPYASFTFQVQDNGGTANGGVDMDATPATLTVNVTNNANSAPQGADNTLVTLEDAAHVFTTADFGFTDVADLPANQLLAVRITAVPVLGTLRLNGVAVNAGDFVLASDIDAGLLVFTPGHNDHGAGYASFGFQVQDDGGTANGGIDLDPVVHTMTIDVTSVDDAPLGADKTVTIDEDTSYTFGTADFGFTDPDDAPGDALQGVRITTMPILGSLTLNGVAVTAGQVIAAADLLAGLLVYTPGANGHGAGYASFSFQVQDNGSTANGGVNQDATSRTITVDVTAVNDAPVGTDHTVSTREDTAYTLTVADFGFADADDAPANAFLAVRIATLPGLGSLTLNGVAVQAGDVISVADIATGLLVYTPVANANGAGHTSFTFQVQDNGGTANGGVDMDVTPRTMTVDVTSVNDAPVGTSQTVSTNEDVAYTFTVADFGFSDPNDSPANALSGVRITTLPAAGSLRLNGVAVHAGDFVSAVDIAAGLLVYLPVANGHGAGHASFTFQLQDDGGTANGGFDLDGMPRTMTVNVTSVNDAPVGADMVVVTHEDTAYTFTVADFGFTDPDDTPDDALLAVRIATVPGAGSLRLNGVLVNPGDFISVADIAAGLLVYTPGTNDHGAGYANFTFQVQDDGGTAHGGINLDGTPRTMTVDVNSVNDAPTGASTTITTLEDTAYTFTAADFGFSDPNDTPANTFSGVRITTLPTPGSLMLNGVAVTVGQTISALDISAGLLVYTPGANDHGSAYASFTFQVRDNGGTANGGVEMDVAPRTMTLNVTAVNDAPVGTDKTVTTLEDTAYTFTAADFGFTDPNDSPADTFSGVRITTLPATGSLTLNGVAVTAGQVISAADIASNLLRFTPATDENGAGQASFTFQVQDSGATANGGVNLDATPRTMTVDVTSVNDAPVGTSRTVSTHEGTVYTFTLADFGFTDPKDAPGPALLAVRITTLSGRGSLSLNGVVVQAGDFVSAADIAAGLLVYTPNANDHGAGYTSFSFQVQDNGGTANGGVNLDGTPRTMTIDVNPVNDAPVGASTTITTLEDTAYTFMVADFGFDDPNDTPVNAFLGVRITTLPGTGSLRLNGVAVTAGQTILAADIAAGLLVYTPGANNQGAGSASFAFQVRDDGGTAHGGIDLDTTPRTVTFDVTGVNDAPVGADKTLSLTEGSTYAFGVGDFGFSDLHDVPANAFWAVRIVSVSGAGSFTLDGMALAAGDLVPVSDLAAGKLVFTAPGGGAQASFTFRVMDDGGTALSGSNMDATARRMSIVVNALTVPDLPGGGGSANPGTGNGNGGSPSNPSTNPNTPTNPPPPSTDAKDDQGGDQAVVPPKDSSPVTEDAILPVPGNVKGATGADGRGTSVYSSSYDLVSQRLGFGLRLDAVDFDLILGTGHIQVESGIKAASPMGVDLTLSFSGVGVKGSDHSGPGLAFAETAEDRQVKVEKMVVQTSGAVLSIGAVWWAARMSGLLASLMISTPAWRSIDPLPVMGLGGDGPDGVDEDGHGDDPDGMDARAARLFGAGKGRDHELEGIG